MEKKTVKRVTKKRETNVLEFSSDEVSLLMEALKAMEKKDGGRYQCKSNLVRAFLREGI